MAARATAQELVAGRLWQVDGADLLASAYAFHAGLPRQAATTAHVQAMSGSAALHGIDAGLPDRALLARTTRDHRGSWGVVCDRQRTVLPTKALTTLPKAAIARTRRHPPGSTHTQLET